MRCAFQRWIRATFPFLWARLKDSYTDAAPRWRRSRCWQPQHSEPKTDVRWITNFLLTTKCLFSLDAGPQTVIFCRRPEFPPGRSKRSGTMAAKRMTQSQIVKTLAEKSEVSKKAVQQFLEHLAATAIGEVRKTGLFVLPGIGRLVRSDRKARVGRNPATGETINIPAKK